MCFAVISLGKFLHMNKLLVLSCQIVMGISNILLFCNRKRQVGKCYDSEVYQKIKKEVNN